MRAELDRAALNERPRLVVAVLIKVTLLKERVRVVLPDREALCALLEIGKTHMAGVWRELESCGIVRFKRVGKAWEVIVQPDSRLWTVEWVYDRDELARFLEFVERVPGQSQAELLNREPSLCEVMAETGSEAAADQGASSGVTKLVTGGPVRRVPEMGTDSVTCTPSTVQVSRLASLEPVTSTRGIDRRTEGELMAECRRVFGVEIMANYGGIWRLRARENAGKLRRVLAETENAVREGRVETVAGAYANDAWGRFV